VANGRASFVSSHGLEDHRLTNLAGIDLQLSSPICRVVTAHETDLQTRYRICNFLKGELRILGRESERLFA
jgi:hypothetical protein